MHEVNNIDFGNTFSQIRVGEDLLAYLQLVGEDLLERQTLNTTWRFGFKVFGIKII